MDTETDKFNFTGMQVYQYLNLSIKRSIYLVTETTQDQLLDLFHPIPSLWDKQHPDYKRSEKNWPHLNRIGKVIGCTGELALGSTKRHNKLK